MRFRIGLMMFLLGIAPGGAAAAEHRLELSGWTFSKGPEFPGAAGSLAVSGGKLRLDGDFSGGGGYVAAYRKFDVPQAKELRFRVRSDASQVAVRLKDGSGQVQQHFFSIGNPGVEQEIAVPFAASRKYFWGGAADGVLRPPVREIGVVIHRKHLKGSGFCEISAPRLSSGTPPFPAEPLRLEGYDASRISVNGRASVTKRGDRLAVSIPAEQPISWPGINLRPQNGSPYFDLSRGSVLAMEVTNRSDHQIAVKCQIENLGANGREFCVRGGRALNPGESGTLRVRYYRGGAAGAGVKFDGVLSPPEGLDGRNSLDVGAVTNIMLFTQPLGREVKFEVGDIRIEEPFGGLPEALKSAETFYPCIDRYGQYKHREWAGKTRSDAELAAARDAETADLEANPRPAQWNRFGGWEAGPQLEATGGFRVEKYRGKWYLIDPAGRLFFSHGICQFEREQITGITLREPYFEELPEMGSPEAKGLYRKQGYAPGADSFYRSRKVVPDAFDFYGANLRRKYGAGWEEAVRDRLFRRIGSWGINTMGNWSARLYAREGKVPYVMQAYSHAAPRILGHRGVWADFQDVFDPRFEPAIEKYLRDTWAFAASDPMCIGIFVDNEHVWGDETALARAVLASPAEQPAKREFRRRLEEKYGSVGKLNAAWKSSYASFDAFLEATAPPGPAARPDLLAFNDAVIERYFEGARAAVKRFAPGKLYLGCRFAGTPNRRVARIAAGYCDVMSYNIYEYSVEAFRLPEQIDKPVLVGEFHFGTLAGGNSYPGLQGSASQAERGRDYRRYLEGALRNPQIVGTHYYRLIDQSAAGRALDNENIGFGFLDLCDRPWPEMVAAAREIAGRLYEIRTGSALPEPDAPPEKR